ncbi:uncharacterized protein C8A04DRAFT_29802 [Dichotomopilus funicola]|uniref:Uncharacterized protein n=1 Tax=Dichotomopilus funicola TaxID=1934379 RepID=A0AAN6V0H3_9PEZI|nr:hypothetical protein C8A04DRAFT_29802 [Dichotomopilus funicola]
MAPRLAFLLLFSCLTTVGRPLPLELGNPEPVYAYVPNPAGRGTIGLVYTCLLTLALCLWTAMHPDVAFCRGSWIYGPTYKVTWMVCAIILPEFVVCSAASQFLQARALHKEWEAYWGKRRDPKRQRWLGLEGAFLVVMGGYKITCPVTRSQETPAMDRGSAPNLQSADAISRVGVDCTCPNAMDGGQPVRRILRPAGLSQLLALEDGAFFSKLVKSGVLNETHFDRRHVSDKGKANYAAKLLTAVQILWIVVQWIARKVDGLAITLLEVHVLIGIPYTLIAYFFWWSKPLDVSMPIVLPICHHLPPDSDTFGQWRLSASQSCAELDGRDSGPSRHHQPMRPRRASPSLLSVITRAGYDFAWNFDQRAELLSALMAVINGCLHATAWVSHFPTTVERDLWRAACLGVTLGPVAIYVIVRETDLECRGLQFLHRLATRDVKSLKTAKNLINEAVVEMWALIVRPSSVETSAGNRDSVRGMPAAWPTWCRHLVALALMICGAIYTASMWYFIVEAFISLRGIPASAYRTVDWTNYWPHF